MPTKALAAHKPKPLGDLMRRVRTAVGVSIPDMAKRLDVDKNTLGSYERQERSLPTPEFLAQFAAETGADLGELLQARFAAAPEQSHELLAALHRIRETTDDTAPPTAMRQDVPGYGYVKVPLYDIKASAGPGRLVQATEVVVSELAFREEWIRSTLHASPDDLGLAYVEGDSGEPDLRTGDIFLYNRRDVTANREGIYFIRMGDALLIKQLQRLPGAMLKVSSRNQNYESFTIPLARLDEPEAFAIIGRVVWACRRL